MESEMRHEARQVPSWLIFDVGRNTVAMRTSESRCFEEAAAGDSAAWWKVSRGLTTGNPVGECVEGERCPKESFPVHPMRNGFEGFLAVKSTAAALPKGPQRCPNLQFAFFSVQFSSSSQTPNKAPEPTPVAVMPRAMSRSAEMKLRNQTRSEARVTPATGVAHL